jgi:formamidopyrimidine-DNA glycosylase
MPELSGVKIFRRYVDATSRHQKIKSLAVRNEKILGGDSARKLQRAMNFRERLEGTRGGVRATLMNQKILAGIGNVYSDEILFQARLHPETSVAHLDGSSPRRAPQRDTVGAGDGDRTGSRSAQVTGLLSALPPAREREVPAGNREIRKIKAAGRIAYHCPACQPDER